MKRIYQEWLFVILLVSLIYPQELGRRVEVTLKNGYLFRGTISQRDKDGVILDITFEYPALSGTITLRWDQIEGLKELRPLKAQEIKKITAQKQQIKAELERQNEELRGAREKMEQARLQAEQTAQTQKEKSEQAKTIQALIEETQQLQEGLKLLEEYPVEQWNRQRYEILKDRLVVLGIPLSQKEQKFVDNFELWERAKEHLESLQSKESQTPAE